MQRLKCAHCGHSPRTPRDTPTARRLELERRLKEKQLRDRVTLDQYFAQFDVDNNDCLDKSELATLLLFLQPEAPPDVQTLDMLLAECAIEAKNQREVGSAAADGDDATPVSAVPRELFCFVIQKFLSFVKEQKYLVEIFTKFDMNSSGYLETDELLRLIEAIGSGHVRHFADDDPTAAHAEAVTYKLKSLDDLRDKKIIDESTWREKRLKCFQRNTHLVSPRRIGRQPDDGDVEFILALLDRNGDLRISLKEWVARSECLAAVGTWLEVSKISAPDSMLVSVRRFSRGTEDRLALAALKVQSTTQACQIS